MHNSLSLVFITQWRKKSVVSQVTSCYEFSPTINSGAQHFLWPWLCKLQIAAHRVCDCGKCKMTSVLATRNLTEEQKIKICEQVRLGGKEETNIKPRNRCECSKTNQRRPNQRNLPISWESNEVFVPCDLKAKSKINAWMMNHRKATFFVLVFYSVRE